MRNLRYYLISFAINASMLGALAYALGWMSSAPPQFSLRQGQDAGSTGFEDSDTVVIEGEFLPHNQTTEIRLEPIRPEKLPEKSTETQSVETPRLFKPIVDAHDVVRKTELPVPEPPRPLRPRLRRSCRRRRPSGSMRRCPTLRRRCRRRAVLMWES